MVSKKDAGLSDSTLPSVRAKHRTSINRRVGRANRTPGSGLKTKDSRLVLLSHSPKDTQEIGGKIGEMAESGDLYLLLGNLGAGKTCLTQGIAWGLGVRGFISSPSFVILREYQGRIPLYHVDLYRMQSIQEIRELGLEDYLYGKGVCVVEWANRGWDYTGGFMATEIKIVSEEQRLLTFAFRGERYARMIDELRVAFGKAENRE